MLSFVESNKKAKKQPLLGAEEEISGIPLTDGTNMQSDSLSSELMESNDANESAEKDLDTVMRSVDNICINIFTCCHWKRLQRCRSSHPLCSYFVFYTSVSLILAGITQQRLQYCHVSLYNNLLCEHRISDWRMDISSL